MPQYLTKSETVVRTNPEIRKAKRFDAIELKSEQFLKADVIGNFDIFKVHFEEKVNFENYLLFENDDKIVFILIENSSDLDCIFSVRISINKYLEVKVILKVSEVPYDELMNLVNLAETFIYFSFLIKLLISQTNNITCLC